MKILWVDTETTGLVPGKHDPVQISGIVEIDGEIKEEFNILSQPIKDNIQFVEEKALSVQGKTLEQITSYPYDHPQICHMSLVNILGKYVDKYDKNDKFWMGGFNTQFDLSMLKAWFFNNGDKFFGSWFHYKCLDVMQVAFILMYADKIKKLNHYGLSTLCEAYGIELDAHNAMNDIRATRELFLRLKGEL